MIPAQIADLYLCWGQGMQANVGRWELTGGGLPIVETVPVEHKRARKQIA